MVEKDSQTFKNLKAAFSGESKARNKYIFYAQSARKEGLDSTAELFEKLARNEQQHALFWYKQIHEGLDDTVVNLKEAIKGENFEWTSMYASFAKDARKEGYEDIATMFEQVANIESTHERQFKEMLDLLEGKGEEPSPNQPPRGWRCKICGHVEFSVEDPGVCPVCGMEHEFERYF